MPKGLFKPNQESKNSFDKLKTRPKEELLAHPLFSVDNFMQLVHLEEFNSTTNMTLSEISRNPSSLTDVISHQESHPIPYQFDYSYVVSDKQYIPYLNMTPNGFYKVGASQFYFDQNGQVQMVTINFSPSIVRQMQKSLWDYPIDDLSLGSFAFGQYSDAFNFAYFNIYVDGNPRLLEAVIDWMGLEMYRLSDEQQNQLTDMTMPEALKEHYDESIEKEAHKKHHHCVLF